MDRHRATGIQIDPQHLAQHHIRNVHIIPAGIVKICQLMDIVILGIHLYGTSILQRTVDLVVRSDEYQFPFVAVRIVVDIYIGVEIQLMDILHLTTLIHSVDRNHQII